MSDWRSTVKSQAEQVVEYYGISGHNRRAVESLTDDSLFQELAMAHWSADLADSAARAPDADPAAERMGDAVDAAADDLLGLLRDRGADLLTAEAFDPEESEA